MGDPLSQLVKQVIAIVGTIAGEEVKRRLQRREQRQAFERAVAVAYQDLKRRYPTAETAFFDLVFLSNASAPLLAEFFTRRGELPTADRVVRAWEAAYGIAAHSWPEVHDAAEFLLRRLEEELLAADALQQFHDRRERGITARSTEAAAREVEAIREDMRQEALLTALDRLATAARAYERAATLIASQQGDAEQAQIRGRDQYREARRRLRWLHDPSSPMLEETHRQFQAMVLDPYEALVDSQAAARDFRPYLEQLRESVERYLDALDEMIP